MITIRRAGERLRTRIGWLDSRHSFSFEEHIDPRHMGFRALRVLNEHRVEPGHGFGTHSRRDMEIVTYVISGALRHEDSLGRGSVVDAGGVQCLTAGTGVLHGESNASDADPLHVLEMWITPERARLAPAFEQRAFPPDRRHGRLTLLVSRDGRAGSLAIPQDVAIFSASLDAGSRVSHVLQPGRHAWAQAVRGSIQLNGTALSAGDGAAIVDEAVDLTASSASETLLIDLA
jgi:redox-sensitive bicupin YhaK (pirin superfamily)